MRIRQQGFISFGSMTLIIGGLALFGLLFYGQASGHELPLWPALLKTASSSPFSLSKTDFTKLPLALLMGSTSQTANLDCFPVVH